MGARDFGISFGKIAAKYKIPHSTVSGIVYCAQKQDNGKTLSCPGWPKVLMEKDFSQHTELWKTILMLNLNYTNNLLKINDNCNHYRTRSLIKRHSYNKNARTMYFFKQHFRSCIIQ